MEVISIGFICIGGIIIYNNISLTYNLLNPKPKIFKVQEHMKNYKSNIEKEFDSQFNQLYKQDSQYILIEETTENNFIGQKFGKIVKKVNQEINQKVNQKINQKVNQKINQKVNQEINQKV